MPFVGSWCDTNGRSAVGGVLVTGASRGIGRAVALAFAAKGDRVAVHYGHRAADAEETVAALPGEGHLLIGGDLADPEAARRIADAAEAGLGGVDVLVNNAAVATSAETAHPVASVSYADWQRIWRRTFDVNLFGAANLSYCVARHLITRGAPGRIVNIGSRGAFRGEPDHPAYGASKAALHAFGFTATERVADRIDDALLAQSPFGRVGTPEEVAAAVVYLASAEATWASGAILDLNGASHLRM
jgi:3-oxoacyl-[acyl-carrier protein] reductase